MGHVGWWRQFGLEAELEVVDDPVEGCGVFQELKNVIKKIEGSESSKKLLETPSCFDNYMVVNYYSIKQIWKAILIFMCSC
jgi:hypothetical protein